MPLVINQGYRQKYVVGGRGLFDSVTNILGRVFTSSAAKTLGSKAMNAATNAAIKGVEKGASKAANHVVEKVTRRGKTPKNIPIKRTQQQQAILNNLISGAGISTIHDFVKRYK